MCAGVLGSFTHGRSRCRRARIIKFRLLLDQRADRSRWCFQRRRCGYRGRTNSLTRCCYLGRRKQGVILGWHWSRRWDWRRLELQWHLHTHRSQGFHQPSDDTASVRSVHRGSASRIPKQLGCSDLHRRHVDDSICCACCSGSKTDASWCINTVAGNRDACQARKRPCASTKPSRKAAARPQTLECTGCCERMQRFKPCCSTKGIRVSNARDPNALPSSTPARERTLLGWRDRG